MTATTAAAREGGCLCGAVRYRLGAEPSGASERDRLNVAVATLDDPAGLAPERHDWVSSRLPWFGTADALPRHGEGWDNG